MSLIVFFAKIGILKTNTILSLYVQFTYILENSSLKHIFFYKRPNIMKFIELLKSGNSVILTNLGIFLYYAFMLRKSLLIGVLWTRKNIVDSYFVIYSHSNEKRRLFYDKPHLKKYNLLNTRCPQEVNIWNSWTLKLNTSNKRN